MGDKFHSISFLALLAAIVGMVMTGHGDDNLVEPLYALLSAIFGVGVGAKIPMGKKN